MFSNDLLLVYGKGTSILSQISNVDKTAVFLSMPHNYAVNSKGGNQGAMKTKGYKMLCYCPAVYNCMDYTGVNRDWLGCVRECWPDVLSKP
jgi:hypothetical protein